MFRTGSGGWRRWARRSGLGLAAAAVVALSSTAASATPAGTSTRLPSYVVVPQNCDYIPPNPDLAVAKTVYRVGRQLGASSKVMLAGFEAGLVESNMNNLPCGDRDSLGVFQQRPSQGWGTAAQIMNVAYASNSFFTRAINVAAAYPGLSAGQVAQKVQVSAYPDRYDQAQSAAGALIARVKRALSDHVSDFSGDGYADVLAVWDNGELHYYPNNGLKLSGNTKIGPGWGSFRFVTAADWSGDGSADVLGVNAAGDLLYYAHNGNGLSSPVKIGHGWSSFQQVMAADWSGDGHADVLGVNAAGDLLYYPHNGNGLSSPVKIGHGWSTFRQVTAADWSGDGHADILGVDSAGKLWYYPHNGNGLSSRVEIGHGFQTFTSVFAADFSGDGHADVLAVDASGYLWYYPHSGNGFGTRVQLGHGFGTCTFVL
ncbi:FG-GAP repeat domain-containing protein [Actinocatenispora sera]|uniref:FG-GAP repeat domain-containing protein n=1 Tax=Actinocatenispora sera TaxID=390989 RepID=UPI000AACA085|nr:VCBS repeat-containing protein [Actinocatenispora sera]